MERAGRHAAIAEANLQAGNLEGARTNIRSAIAERDDVADYYIILGRTELAAGSLISTFNAYSMALDLQADNAEALQSIAEIGLQIGRTNEAAEAADRILLLAPQSVNALLIKGLIEIDNGQLEKAEEIAAKILSINPDDEGGSILSARIEAIQGDDERALAIIDKAIAKSGLTQALSITKLEILRLRADGTGMKILFPRIIQNGKESLGYKMDYINLLYKLGDTESARSEAVKSIKQNAADPDLFNKLGDLWVEHDRSPLTANQIDDIAANGGKGTKIRLAKKFYELQNYKQAQHLVRDLMVAGNTEALALTAKIQLALGNSKGAYSMAAKALKAEPTNEDALIVRSQQAVSNRNFDRAIRDASLVLSNSPQNHEAYVQMAKVYTASGKPVRARQTFEAGMDALPQSLALVVAYEDFLKNVDDLNRIPTAYGELAVAKPSSVAAWRAYAAACQRYAESACTSKAEKGIVRAQNSLMIDDVPGSPKRRGLFARITPERICAITGGVCTDS